MHADISRRPFDPDAAFSAVVQQQGRVLLDADWNEHVDIDLHDRRRGRVDIIGPTGAPSDAPGMLVAAAGGGLTLGAGRFYVDGIVCENTDEVHLDDAPTADGRYLVHLEVAERTITAAELPGLREVALGGPDTTARTRVEWRVQFLGVDDGTDCLDVPSAWQRLLDGPTGTAAMSTAPVATTTGPCLVPEESGYRGLDNRAYLVQVHEGDFDPTVASGSDGTAPTFLWSRDAGSVLARVTAAPSGVDVPVDRVGPGGAEGFVRGGWVEVTDDHRLRAREPGVLAEVDDVTGATLTLVDRTGLAAELSTLWGTDRTTVVRRWDSAGALPLGVGTPIDLDDGIRVEFGAGTWRSGDWWLVAARTAVLPGTDGRNLDWPTDGGGSPLALPPHGSVRHRARLAMAQLSGGVWTVDDCRAVFAPLTRQVTLTMRGGDGQEAPGGHWLPAPVSIGVGSGAEPVEGARLRVTVETGGGGLSVAEPNADGTAPGGTDTTAHVDTGPDGIARAWWRLGPVATPPLPGDLFHPEADQRIRVELLDLGGDPTTLPLRVHARASDRLALVAAGGDGQIGRPGDTLEIALRARVSAGGTAAPGRTVRFTVPSRMLDGTALDEFGGGSLHATTNVVATTPWPGGSRARIADVATDDDGVAQLQWTLGNEPELHVQRVQAVLLDDGGEPTAQETLFTAHLAMADQIGWTPPAGVGAGLGATGTVQEALASIGAIAIIGLTQAAILDVGGARRIEPGFSTGLGDFEGLQITSAWQPSSDPSAEALLGGLVVAADRPEGQGNAVSGFSPVHLLGKTQIERTRRGMQVTWAIGRPSRQMLQRALAGAPGGIVVRVRLLPAALSRELPTPPPWEIAFRVTT